MRKGKIFTYLLTVVFLAAAVFIGIIDLEWEPFPFSVIVSSDGETEEIDCWKNTKGEFFVFLPSYAELSQVQIVANQFHTVSLDGQPLSNGMSCENFRLNVPLELSYTDNHTTYQYVLQFVQSANVETVYIDVPSGNMDYIHEEKGNEEPGTIRIYSAEGVQTHLGDLESIKGRGNATWLDEKKAYSLKLSEEADLLGSGQAQNWILLANAYDGSHMKNKITYDLADAMGLAYSPDCQWVDLYLNGEYAGLYLLTERNEVHSQRVAIGEDRGFLVAMEPQYRLEEQGYPFVTTQSGVALRIHHALMPTEDVAQIWQSAENAILAEDGIDPDTGKHWQDLIDVDSWAQKYLMEEVLGNFDAAFASQFFYYDGSDPSAKIFAGPTWDMDDSMGSNFWISSDSQAFLVFKPHLTSSSDTPWFYALYEKDVFRERMVETYRMKFRPLLQELLDSGLDQHYAQIAQASAANAMRWTVPDTAESIEKICSYLQQRIDFFDDLWLEGTPYCMVQIKAGDAPWAYFAVRQGEYLPALPEFENTETTVYHGWYTMDTDKPFDITQPIFEDAAIYMKQEAIG